MLLHLIDMAPFDEAVDPVADARALVKELKKYDPKLAEKPRWLVLNKMDVLSEEDRAARVTDIKRRLRHKGPVYVISALARNGTEDLCRDLYDFVAALKPADAPDYDPRFAPDSSEEVDAAK